MLHKSIRIPLNFAHQIMNQIGNVENGLEFVDLNQNLIDTKKPYYSLMTRCEELEKVFQKFEDICLMKNIPFMNYHSYDLFNSHIEKEISVRDKVSGSAYFDLIETEILEDEKRIDEQLKLGEELRKDYLKVYEEKQICNILNAMFRQGEIPRIQHKDIESETSLYYIAGICNTVDEIKIKRMTFRISKGRAIPGFFKINIEKNNEFTQKEFDRKMFFIIVQGSYLKTKVTNLLNIFSCFIYNIPNPDDVKNILDKTEKDLVLKNKLIVESEKRFIQFLTLRASNTRDLVSLYGLYKNYVKKEKMIYFNLNKCVIQTNFINGEVWIPEDKYNLILHELQLLYTTNEQILPPGFITLEIEDDERPPTYFKSNDFIYPFQKITDTYGIPRYKEINPGLFSIITFPFLFGIMFGDLGHGFLLLLGAAYLCLAKEDIMKSNSILKPLIKARYILLLMGFYAFYCGLMYNDFMALPTSFFNSCYDTDPVTKITTKITGCVYPIGIDPKWYTSKNQLAFANSFKMKWSVIVGVIQITFGIILRGMNNLFFKDKLGFICEFIPQLLFFSSIFGYMIALIYTKWATDWTGRENMAPSIISILMGMVLKNGSVNNKPMWGSIAIEEKTNRYLLYLAVLCVPIILLPKPLITIFFSESTSTTKVEDMKKETIEEPLLHQAKKRRRIKNNEAPADILVEQCIFTIEFVLGTISSTASYLRLWALSLAHAQLSHVFFEKALLTCAEMDSILLIIIGFFVFANLTVFVLMGMDLMEASLHTLRLHWVEFQNKFYYADGNKYNPFSFRKLIEEE